jgi:hypothetical protein
MNHNTQQRYPFIQLENKMENSVVMEKWQGKWHAHQNNFPQQLSNNNENANTNAIGRGKFMAPAHFAPQTFT